MKNTMVVFSVIMVQLALSIFWFGCSVDVFWIWVWGCCIANVLSAITFVFFDMEIGG